jgi:2,3,4,5-tetrahydropyridine-2-carboxylate N-succinyltransferase
LSGPLARILEELAAAAVPPVDESRAAVGELLVGLGSGRIRAAERQDGRWQANAWVKRGILLAFRVGALAEFPPAGALRFFDKDTLPLSPFTRSSGVRIVPGGTSVRAGAYVAPGVTIMPPAFVNVGAYVDGGSLVDSHVLVGSCAQVGRRVHVSAGAQIGGVLEPAGELPVILEDEVFVGGDAGIYEGAVVRAGAVLAAGVVLTRATPVYDVVRGEVYRAADGRPLEIPERAVVVPGSRAIRDGKGAEWGLSIQTPVIVKYRDARTDAAAALEAALR